MLDERTAWALPDELTRVPGLVGDVTEAALERGTASTRTEALAEAVALQGLLACPCLTVGEGIRTNVMALAVLRGPRQAWTMGSLAESLLDTARVDCAVDDGIRGIRQLESALLDCPRLLVAAGARAQLGHALAHSPSSPMLLALKRMQTRAGGCYILRGYAHAPRCVVHNPCVCVAGAAGEADVACALRAGGLPARVLARFVLLRAGEAGTHGVRVGRSTPTADLVRAVEWWRDRAPPRDRAGGPSPLPSARVAMTIQGRQALRGFEQYARTRQRGAHNAGGAALATAWSRAQENALRLAAVYACSAQPEHPTITKAAAAWACELVVHSAGSLAVCRAREVTR